MMRERRSGRTEGLCWAALMTGLAACAYTVHAMLSGWAFAVAQQWSGMVVAVR